MRLYHLSGRKVCDAVVRKGRVWKGKNLIVRWMSGAPKGLKPPMKQGLYVGTLASTKLSKKAVERNRMRRRCREALRLAVRERDSLPAIQLLLCPRAASLHAPFADIQREVGMFLATLPQAGTPAAK
ncbi:ribonuclease P protein component [Candidatus Peregrinibacteria bacterium]|nr:ribonuclease P protein component [Candidatus Peregrinibacteria bacterium]